MVIFVFLYLAVIFFMFFCGFRLMIIFEVNLFFVFRLVSGFGGLILFCGIFILNCGFFFFFVFIFFFSVFVVFLFNIIVFLIINLGFIIGVIRLGSDLFFELVREFRGFTSSGKWILRFSMSVYFFCFGFLRIFWVIFFWFWLDINIVGVVNVSVNEWVGSVMVELKSIRNFFLFFKNK